MEVKRHYYRYLWIILGVSFVLSHCSKNGEEVNELPELVVMLSDTTVFVGDKLSFQITTNNQPIGADIYIDDQKVSGSDYVFEETGDYLIQARKSGYQNSSVIVVTVIDKPTLTFTASETEIFAGERVTFTVTSSGKTVSADIYVNDQKISGNNYTFDKVGNYRVQARQDGYSDSNELTIVVSEKPTLILTASATNVFIGDRVTFSVTASGKTVSADIYVNDQKISGNNYTFDKVGNYRVQARQDGYSNSNELTIVVSDKPILALTASATDVFIGDRVTFSVTASGKTVSADIYVNDQKISGNNYTFDKVGNYRVQARQDGYSNSNELTIVVSEPVFRTDIHVAGYEITGGVNHAARYWKNGMAQTLESRTGNAVATDVFVYDNDVYVAGYEEDVNGDRIAGYWKNGVGNALTDGRYNAEATSIFVYNGIVYIAGFESNGLRNVAKYWSNGSAVNLTNGAYDANAFSIFIDNGDVYVAGRESDDNRQIAKYWKNGSQVTLESGNGDATAYSIFVQNDIVYVAGRIEIGENDVAVYWRNGSRTTLGNPQNISTAYSVFYADGNVYVSGEESSASGDLAKLWVNGSGQTLREGSGANSVFVIDKDVYVAGYYYNGDLYISKYWKNGNAVSLSSGQNFAYAYSIYVTKERER